MHAHNDSPHEQIIIIMTRDKHVGGKRQQKLRKYLQDVTSQHTRLHTHSNPPKRGDRGNEPTNTYARTQRPSHDKYGMNTYAHAQ